ncbi:unnamed protein product [Phytophthora fragariaefolia]|uniref:Unnamed protein product n=1 Tax=Phytophthora fragariaefolia TaxID=1490495 RepID=A0A9W6Y7X5_9STRA|nr:unnamed protein product [Phytophthora fragariaefolia]
MAKDKFSENPYPNVNISDDDRSLLVDLVREFVADNFQEYQDFVDRNGSIVDEGRWKHVKSRDNQRVYVERSRRNSVDASDVDPAEKALPAVLSVGTFNGDLDDLMLGVVSLTPDSMRVKASYVRDVDSAAIVCPVVAPSEDEPFASVTIKWMAINLPLQATTLVKRRDFVYMEATGFLRLANGERVGYFLLHSLEFPQTPPRPNTVRGKFSVFGFFRQLDANVLDHFVRGTVDPGGEIRRFLLTSTAVDTMFAVARCVQCGQMKKLSWLLRHGHAAAKRLHHAHSHMHSAHCAMCERSLTCPLSGKPLLGSSACCLCLGPLCRSCKIRKRLTLVAPGGELERRKRAFCASCIAQAAELSAELAARHQAAAAGACERLKSSSSSSMTDTSEGSSLDDELQVIAEESDEDEDDDIPLLSDVSRSDAIPLVF